MLIKGILNLGTKIKQIWFQQYVIRFTEMITYIVCHLFGRYC